MEAVSEVRAEQERYPTIDPVDKGFVSALLSIAYRSAAMETGSEYLLMVAGAIGRDIPEARREAVSDGVLLMMEQDFDEAAEGMQTGALSDLSIDVLRTAYRRAVRTVLHAALPEPCSDLPF